MTDTELPLAFLSGLLLAVAVAYVVERRKRRALETGVERTGKTGDDPRSTTGDHAAHDEAMHMAMEMARAGRFEIDPDAGRAEWSPRALEILGWTGPPPSHIADLAGRVHAADLAEFLAEHEELRTHGRAFDMECRVRHPDGGYAWIHLRIMRSEEEGQASERLIGIIQDVSEKRRTEQALADSERKFRDLVEDSIQAILILDGATPLFCNRACARLLGYDKPEEFVIGGSILSHLTAADADDFGNLWDALMRGERDGIVRRRKVLTRAGKLLDVEVVGRRVQWRDRWVWQATMLDVTERARIEQALQASEAQFRLLADNALDVIIVYNDAEVITYASPSIEQASGYRPSEIVGRPSLELVHPDDLPALLERRRDIRSGKRKAADPLRWRLKRRDGQIRWAETTNAILPSQDGKPPAMISASRDITERVAHEQEMSAARTRMENQANDLAILAQKLDIERERAERANEAKSQFLAMMSHELRTPMTGILGTGDLLLASHLTDEQRDLLRMLMRSGRTLLELLNDILDFSKIEAGQLQMEKTAFRVSDVVTDVRDIFAPSAAEKGLSLKAELPASYADGVIGDPKRLRQVLSNLVGNAVKFTATGCVKIEMSQQVRGNAYVLSFAVIDTGIGISREDAARLFAPFIQADASTSRKFGGTGLGLAICRRLVESMGGEISVESHPGRGSTFSFTVKVEAAPEGVDLDASRNGDPGHPRPQASESRRILLAEDNETNRFLISTVLKRNGHAVDAVENGAEALTAVIEHDYDIVLMDMQMPVMDGAEATREIRKLPSPRNALPVIALTADVIAEHRKGYLAAGVNAIVSKPVNWRELEDEIARQLGDGQLASPPASVPDEDVREVKAEIVDDAALRILAESIGNELLAGMLDSFTENMIQYRDDLKAAALANDMKACKRIAHALKGLSAQFGAPRASELARFVEEEAKNLSAVTPLIPEIETVVAETVESFAARKISLRTSDQMN